MPQIGPVRVLTMIRMGPEKGGSLFLWDEEQEGQQTWSFLGAIFPFFFDHVEETIFRMREVG